MMVTPTIKNNKKLKNNKYVVSMVSILQPLNILFMSKFISTLLQTPPSNLLIYKQKVGKYSYEVVLGKSYTKSFM